MKRAGIYVRTSREKQAEKVSPQAQEQDCRAYCESQGYQVEGVYRDIEKYRLGKRMVEPSGTRADRPGLKALIADVYAKKIDVIIAWREDRLYRSYRPMLLVLEALEDNKISLELAKETFDARIAPVKAWAAKMELDAKHDRFAMGVRGRLENGKWWGSLAYGIQADENGYLIVNEDEARWVRAIWQMWAAGETMNAIQAYLIDAGAQQRRKTKYTWSFPVLRSILRYDAYFTGVTKVEWDGETFELAVPQIVDLETFEAVKARKKAWKQYPAGNQKTKALCAGLVYCAGENVRSTVITNRGTRKNKSGKVVFSYNYYKCPMRSHMGKPGENCYGSIKMDRLDQEVWRRVWRLIAVPGVFEDLISQRVEQISWQETNAAKEVERLETELSAINLERQKVITWARKEIITDGDLEVQLSMLAGAEKDLRRALNEKRLLTGNRAETLKRLAELTRLKFRRGLEELNANPEDPKQAKRIFEYRKKVVKALVKRIEIDHDKNIIVFTEVDFAQVPFDEKKLMISEPSF